MSETKVMVGVIDYGVGNLGSVMRALESLEATPKLIDRPADLPKMDRLILPGVGNFADCARLLAAGGWPSAIVDGVGQGQPLLGICVGMQLLACSSSEGDGSGPSEVFSGLSLIPGRVRHLRELGCQLRAPHVGWNSLASLTLKGCESGLFHGIPDGTDFYFVHSYVLVPEEDSAVLAVTDYGVPLTAAVQIGNVWGTQFHPEKSSRAGFQVIQNFLSPNLC
jgi:imidazole glycerol-phosphate synthase subunit HisH